MSIIAVIPARYNSTRFPGKPLVDIDGKTMIQRVYEQAKKVSLLDMVVVATDDNRIYNHCKSIGAEVMMTSSEHRNGTERIAEVIRNIDGDYDFVLNIQGDEPFVHPEQIEMLANEIASGKNHIATLVKQIDDDKELVSTNTVKVVLSKNNKALYFSRYSIPFNRNIDSNLVHFKHIGMYAFKINILQKLIMLEPSNLEIAESLEQLRWLENDYSIGAAISQYDSFGIDTPEDIELALLKLRK